MPSRLVDLSGDLYQLVEPVQGSQVSYAALSYRWGRCIGMTTRKTLPSFKKGISAESMPIVFREAAIICRKLDLNFLWIDSLCIVQDDEDDWRTEAANMAEIYENANIVLSISASASPETSFLSPRLSVVEAVPLQFRGTTGRLKARSRLNSGLHASPGGTSKDVLDQRGWALQEKELASRWLSLSTSELQWKCKKLEDCECLALTSESYSLLRDSDLSGEKLFRRWHYIVTEYSSRDLTKQTDIFPALIGLAKKFNSISKATYVAGMWKEHLMEDLVWEKQHSHGFSTVTDYLAPSFSWASTPGTVTHHQNRRQHPGTRIYHSTISHVEITTIDNEPYSRVVGGSLILRGPVINAMIACSNPEEPDCYTLSIASRQYKSQVMFLNEHMSTGCEFTIDSPLTAYWTTESQGVQSPTVAVRRARGMEKPRDPFGFTLVKLISLYALTRSSKASVYENFLILGYDGIQFQRIGIGTSKIYLSNCEKYSSRLDNPFSWLYEDKGSQSVAHQEYSTEEVRIV
jgi:hypothetical protein